MARARVAGEVFFRGCGMPAPGILGGAVVCLLCVVAGAGAGDESRPERVVDVRVDYAQVLDGPGGLPATLPAEGEQLFLAWAVRAGAARSTADDSPKPILRRVVHDTDARHEGRLAGQAGPARKTTHVLSSADAPVIRLGGSIRPGQIVPSITVAAYLDGQRIGRWKATGLKYHSDEPRAKLHTALNIAIPLARLRPGQHTVLVKATSASKTHDPDLANNSREVTVLVRKDPSRGRDERAIPALGWRGPWRAREREGASGEVVSLASADVAIAVTGPAASVTQSTAFESAAESEAEVGRFISLPNHAVISRFDHRFEGDWYVGETFLPLGSAELYADSVSREYDKVEYAETDSSWYNFTDVTRSCEPGLLKKLGNNVYVERAFPIRHGSEFVSKITWQQLPEIDCEGVRQVSCRLGIPCDRIPESVGAEWRHFFSAEDRELRSDWLDRTVKRLSVTVQLPDGVAAGAVFSPTHEVMATDRPNGGVAVSCSQTDAPLKGELRVCYGPALSSAADAEAAGVDAGDGWAGRLFVSEEGRNGVAFLVTLDSSSVPGEAAQRRYTILTDNRSPELEAQMRKLAPATTATASFKTLSPAARSPRGGRRDRVPRPSAAERMKLRDHEPFLDGLRAALRKRSKEQHVVMLLSPWLSELGAIDLLADALCGNMSTNACVLAVPTTTETGVYLISRAGTKLALAPRKQEMLEQRLRRIETMLAKPLISNPKLSIAGAEFPCEDASIVRGGRLTFAGIKKDFCKGTRKASLAYHVGDVARKTDLVLDFDRAERVPGIRPVCAAEEYGAWLAFARQKRGFSAKAKLRLLRFALYESIVTTETSYLILPTVEDFLRRNIALRNPHSQTN